MQLIVLGMHRTGTSVLTGLLKRMGAYFGPLELSVPASEENRKGFWERCDVVDLDQRTLEACDADWFRVSKLDLNNLADPNAFRTQAGRILAEMDQNQPWVMKDPRLCLLFPLWKEFLQSPICLHTHRNPIETARSLQVRNGFPLQAGIALWEKYNLDALSASSGLPRLLISYEELLESPVEVVWNLYNDLCNLGVRGLTVPEEAEIRLFVDCSLYRSRVNDSLQAGYLNSQQQNLHTAFEDNSIFAWRSLPDVSAGALESLVLLEADDTIKKRNRLLEDRVDELDALLSAEHGRNRQMIERIDDLDTALLAQQGRNRQMIERIDELDTALLAQQGRNRQIIERNDDLDAALLAQRGRGRQLEKHNKTLDAALLSAQGQNRQLERRVAKLDTDHLDSSGRNRQLEERVANLDADLLAGIGRNRQLEERIEKLNAELLAGDGLNTQLQQRIQELDAELLAGKGRNWQQEQRIAELDAALLAMTGRCRQFEERVEELDALLLARLGLNRQLEHRVRELDQEKELQRQQIEIARTEIAELKESIRNLDIERTNLYNSTSWKIGNTLVKGAIKLTFRNVHSESDRNDAH
ncbi:MAG: sulfotransferase [Methylococcales bacterium]